MPITSAERLESQPEDRYVARDIEEEYAREFKKLCDLGFVFLNAVDGDSADAEELLDSFIDLLFEGGAFSTWRYRILLAEIRKGL